MESVLKLPRLDYQERRQAKKERLQELANKNHEQAKQELNQALGLSDQIPLGQPVQVGHHSERMHRRHLEKIDNKMRQSIKTKSKADYYDKRVKAMDQNYAISQDDPEAVKRLKEKLEGVLKEIEYWKGIPKKPRTFNFKDPEDQRWYMLPNRQAEKRRIIKRIEALQQQAEIKEESWQNGEIKIEVNKTENRLMVYFPGKPDEETRTKLKRNGFRWSPRNQAWQSYINDNNICWAKREILNKVD